MSDEQKAPEATEESKAPETTETQDAPKAEEQKEATPETPAEEPAAEVPAQEVSEAPASEDASEEAPAETDSEEDVPVFKEKLENFDELKPGMTVRLHERITDVSPKGEPRERVQVFEGMILGIRGAGISRTMTIRKVSKGFGVEKIYPINSPVIAKIELVKIARVRQAKLGYLKNLKRRFKRRLKETWIDQGTKKKKRGRRK